MANSEELFRQVDQGLQGFAQELAEFRSQQGANTASILTLQNLGVQLLDIAQLHQQALRVSQANIEDMKTDIRGLQTENRRILERLERRDYSGN